MTRKKKSITLSIGEAEKERLERIAIAYGQTWGEKPNVSALVKAIANGSIKVAWADPDTSTSPKRAAMVAAIALIQEGLAKLLRIV